MSQRDELALVDRSDETGRGDLWILDIQRNTGTRLTSAEENETAPIWSPDGRNLLISSSRAGNGAIHRIPLEARDEEEPIFADPEHYLTPWSWSTGWISFVKDRDLFAFSTESGQTIPIAVTPYREDAVHLSPDGQWVLYVSD